jgi:peptide/nickel transport system ATP-binding protein
VSLLKRHVATGDAALGPASEREAPRPKPLLAIEHLTKHFPLKGDLFGRTSAVVQAVDDISFAVERGETLGIVGESGCGKSTTARLLMHLIKPDRGSIVFDGQTVGVPEGLSQRELHRQMQMVFQDSYASLNPRLPVAMSIAFGPFVHGLARRGAAGGGRARAGPVRQPLPPRALRWAAPAHQRGARPRPRAAHRHPR